MKLRKNSHILAIGLVIAVALFIGCSAAKLRPGWVAGPFEHWYYIPTADGQVCAEITDLQGDYWVNTDAHFLDPQKAQIFGEYKCAERRHP